MNIKCVDDNETWVRMNIINKKRPDKIYLISDLGRVVEHDPQREPKAFVIKVDHNGGKGRYDKQGYREFLLNNKYYKVHRLVATYFIEDNLYSDLHVHHINGIPGDNRAVNLQWVTPKEHLAIETTEGKRLSIADYRPDQRKYSWKDVCAMRFLHEGQGWSVSQLAGLYDMSIKAMRRILNYTYYKRP